MWEESVIWQGSCIHITWLDIHCLPPVSGRERWRLEGVMWLLSRAPFILLMTLCLPGLWKSWPNGEEGMRDAWLCHPALLYLSMCFSRVDALWKLVHGQHKENSSSSSSSAWALPVRAPDLRIWLSVAKFAYHQWGTMEAPRRKINAQKSDGG